MCGLCVRMCRRDCQWVGCVCPRVVVFSGACVRAGRAAAALRPSPRWPHTSTHRGLCPQPQSLKRPFLHLHTRQTKKGANTVTALPATGGRVPEAAGGDQLVLETPTGTCFRSSRYTRAVTHVHAEAHSGLHSLCALPPKMTVP